MGIEPTSKAWEALILPLNYARSVETIAQLFDPPQEPLVISTPSDSSSAKSTFHVRLTFPIPACIWRGRTKFREGQWRTRICAHSSNGWNAKAN